MQSDTEVKPPKLLNKMPVLVVDDNRTNLKILEEILLGWEMAPVLMNDGKAAMEELQRAASAGQAYRLALVDSQMPDINGFELARKIKSIPSLGSAAILILSSSDLFNEAEFCKALGISRFLRKPVTPSELFDAIITALGIIPGIPAKDTESARMQSVDASDKLHVLVAEDHPINQKLVTQILAERGHTWAIATNGIEALQLLDRQTFDVILMDGQMPEMDGYQATQEIRRREQSTGGHIRIIAVTAHAMKEDRDRCLRAGMDDYVSKPIDADHLVQRLEGRLTSGAESLVTARALSTHVRAPSASFDLEIALKRARGKRSFLVQLTNVFLQDVPNTVDEIRSAAQANDVRRLERAAHRLKGSASTLAAGPVTEAATRLEQLCREDKLELAHTVVADLNILLAELSGELETVVKEIA